MHYSDYSLLYSILFFHAQGEPQKMRLQRQGWQCTFVYIQIVRFYLRNWIHLYKSVGTIEYG